MEDSKIDRYDLIFEAALGMIKHSTWHMDRGEFREGMRLFQDAIGLMAHNHSAEVLFRAHGLRRGRHTPPSIR